MKTDSTLLKTRNCRESCKSCLCKKKVVRVAPRNGENVVTPSDRVTVSVDRQENSREWDYVGILSSGGKDHLHD